MDSFCYDHSYSTNMNKSNNKFARSRFQKPTAADGEKTNGSIPLAIFKQARQSGQLNLSNRSLAEVPDLVWHINMEPGKGEDVSWDSKTEKWWDQVDLSKLILASNQLVQLSQDIRLLPALTVLDIHDNYLTSLPDALGELINLQKMNVAHNKLQSLPENVSRLSNLQFLHIEHNDLTELSDAVCSLTLLDDLDVSHNKLSNLPGNISALTRLMRLNVSHNTLQILPHGIGELSSLRVLDATHNALHSVPDEIGQLVHLEQLFLRHNRLTHLPVLESCSTLKEVHVGNNGITRLTKEHLEGMRNVTMLDLRDNKISHLSDDVAVLQALERLDLTNNSLTTLPPEMGLLQNLKCVVLDGNPMKGIRRDIIMRGTNELKTYLRSRLAEPPSDKRPQGLAKKGGTSGIVGGTGEGVDPFSVNSTKTLDYSEKRASEIPDDLWSVATEAAVTSVNFSKNQLSTWPDRLETLAGSVQHLQLQCNRLSEVSPAIAAFSKLTFLDLRANMLTRLPQEMSSLENMREMNISFNRFREIPPVLYSLGKLEILIASDNQIQPVEVDHLLTMEVLATLDLRNNDIMQVPPRLGLCTQLRSLQLEGNPFRQPRPALLTKGTVALLEYLRDRIPTS